MTQVSRYPLSKAVEEECFELLYATISELHDTQEIKEFLEDFLSPVEQIMLAKRLAIAVLLGKEYDYDAIKRVLRVTPTTIANVNGSLKYSGMGYHRMVMRVLKKERWETFWQKIDDALASVIPPASSNWSYWNKERWQRKMKNRKAL